MIDEDIEALKGVIKSDEKILRLAQAACGNITPNELALLHVICNIAIDACDGDKVQAQEYLRFIIKKEPLLKPLFAAVGLRSIKEEIAEENSER